MVISASSRKDVVQAYGGGSAPDCNGIPYQAPVGHFTQKTFSDLSDMVKERVFAAHAGSTERAHIFNYFRAS